MAIPFHHSRACVDRFTKWDRGVLAFLLFLYLSLERKASCAKSSNFGDKPNNANGNLKGKRKLPPFYRGKRRSKSGETERENDRGRERERGTGRISPNGLRVKPRFRLERSGDRRLRDSTGLSLPFPRIDRACRMSWRGDAANRAIDRDNGEGTRVHSTSKQSSRTPRRSLYGFRAVFCPPVAFASFLLSLPPHRSPPAFASSFFMGVNRAD